MVQQQLLRNRYEIHSVLGEGGFATTYQGIDTHTQNQVAIKTLSFAQMEDWKALESFERESIVLARLDHPGIPKYIDFFYEDTETDRCFYLVRELAVGESLSDLAKKGWRAREEEIKHIIEQLLEILVYLHNLIPPVIHRDIKPSNIIYQPDTGKVFLIDFGSVQDAFGGGTFVGTFGYIAPEQLRGETSPRSDIYSVAMTLAFLLTQREPSELPFQRMKINLRSLKISASNELLEWLEKASEPIPDDRFYSAEDALRNLRLGIQKRLELPRGSKIEVLENKNYIKIRLPFIGTAKDYISPDVITVHQGRRVKYFNISNGDLASWELEKEIMNQPKILKLLVLLEFWFYVSCLLVGISYLILITTSFIMMVMVMVIIVIIFRIAPIDYRIVPIDYYIRRIRLVFMRKINSNSMVIEISKQYFKLEYQFNYFSRDNFRAFNLPVKNLRCSCQVKNYALQKIEIFTNKKKIITFNDELMTPPELLWLYRKISSFLNNSPEKYQNT
jgi:serine/threonine protein kinase